MTWLQVLQSKIFQHRYAINAVMLGDDTEYAWSNLGYWGSGDSSYPDACRQLAVHMAKAVALDSDDMLLDLGCGKGASLLLWQQQFAVQHVEAVELQAQSVAKIKQILPPIQRVLQQSFLDLNDTDFKFKFDVVLCIDAAYHNDIHALLKSIQTVLTSKARIGFHHLMLTEKFYLLNSIEKLKLTALLKCADVNLADLLDEQQIRHLMDRQGFESIQIDNLSTAVLKGFANYVRTGFMERNRQISKQCLDRIKIEMTAKLCQKLYADGYVDYVQICATSKD